jgi:iron-sulfur cluster assembly accessory protein
MDSATETIQTEETTVSPTLAITATASKKVAELLEAEGNTEYYLRVAVQPGGCSGLRYAIFFDDRDIEGDVVNKFGDVTLKIDRMSAPYLKGATLDWLERLDASGFTIDNPMAQGTCACGESFH